MEFNTYLKKYLNEGRLEHSKKVEAFSLKIALCLNPDYDTKLLSYGAFLHDIGASQEGTPHNKIGANIVIENGIKNLSEEELLTVACLVRYHRGSDPKDVHKKFSKLNKDLQKITKEFSSIIRLADALDWKHKNLVDDIDIDIKDKKVFLTLRSNSSILIRVGFLKFFSKKKEFFEKVFKVTVFIKAV